MSQTSECLAIRLLIRKAKKVLHSSVGHRMIPSDFNYLKRPWTTGSILISRFFEKITPLKKNPSTHFVFAAEKRGRYHSMQRSLSHKSMKSFHRMINIVRKSHLQYFSVTPLFLNLYLKSQAYLIIIPFEQNFFIRNGVYRGSPFIMSEFGRLIQGFDFDQKLRA